MDLPSYVLFACLDVEGVGHLSLEQLGKLEDWPSAVAPCIPGAQQLCDPTAQGMVTYAILGCKWAKWAQTREDNN